MIVHNNRRYKPTKKKTSRKDEDVEQLRFTKFNLNDIEEIDEEEGDDDYCEMVGLIHATVTKRKTPKNNKVIKNGPPASMLLRLLKILLTMIAVLSVFTTILCFYARYQQQQQHQQQNPSIGGSNEQNGNTLNIQCPKPLDSNVGEDDIDVGSFLQQGKTLQNMDSAELWQYVMEDDCIDSWGTNYSNFKCRIHDFKQQEFTPYFLSPIDTPKKDDDDIGENIIRIYESACGVGRNLVATLDIALNENYAATTTDTSSTTNSKSKTIVEVYGNDYTSDGAGAARTIFESADEFFNRDIIEAHSNDIPKIQLGSICGGVDSTDLSHIPSNSMDIAYTGYVAPLHDPLNLQETEYPNTTRKEISHEYKKLCSHANTTYKHYDPSAKEQIDQMQSIQNDYFAKWVGEMIRIAKPGAPVICEQVPLPKCVIKHDTGGVSKQFWFDATQNDKYRRDYNWDQIDPTSIKFATATYCDGTERHSHRYHVSMKKKGKE